MGHDRNRGEETMTFNQKETMFLNELKGQEQVCAEKYERYAADACDPALGTLFWDLAQSERRHESILTRLLNGQDVPAPQQNPQGAQQNAQQQDAGVKPAYNGASDGEDKCADAYLCRDALAMEKHVSGVYDTGIFEFTQQSVRDALADIQKQEQQHGKRIYDYMAANGMYN